MYKINYLVKVVLPPINASPAPLESIISLVGILGTG